MASGSTEGQDGRAPVLLDTPSFNTSRRNFVAAASSVVAAGILLGTSLRSKPAQADASDTGCNSSIDQPKSCCFLSGTHIATPNKEVAIENLCVGDPVITLSGEPKPIRWIGRNRFTRNTNEAWNPKVTPVKVARFALNDQSPHSDLYLSPAHALYLYGLLVPVQHLVNGRSITDKHYATAHTLDYYHIELEEHDVVLAEGTPAETYAGNNRWTFDNVDEYEALYDAPAGMKRSFAPVVSLKGCRQELMSRLRSIVSPIYDGRKSLDLIRDHIAARADLQLAA
jgi:hypothetical protein